MTAVRGGQTPDDRISAAARRALQDRERRRDVDAALGAAARSGDSAESEPRRRRRRHDVRRPPREARSAESAASSTRRRGTTRSIDRRRRSRDGDASFKPVYAIVGFAAVPGSGDVRSDGEERHARGCTSTTARRASTTQGLYRLDNADVPAVVARDVRRGALVEHGARGSSCRPTTRRSRASRAGASARRSVSTISSSPCRTASRTPWSSAASRRRRSASRRFDRPTPASSFPAFGSDAQNPREPAATWTCARSSFIRENPTSRSSDPTAASCATTARSRTSAACRLRAVSQRAAVPDDAGAPCPTRCIFLNKGLQTLQFYNIARRSAGSAAAADRRPAGQQHDLAGRHRRSARLEDAVSVRRRHVGVGVPSDAIRTCCSRASRATASSRTSGTAISARWVRTDDPIRAATSARPSRSRPAGSSSRSTGAIRTRSSPRSSTCGARRTTAATQAFLEANCRFSGARRRRDRAATGCRSASRIRSRPAARRTRRAAKPGDLTSDFYGARSHRRPHRRRRAHAGGCRHALGGDELRPAVRLEERRTRRRRRRVHPHRHAGDAQPLRHAHRRRSRESERRVHCRTPASTR